MSALDPVVDESMVWSSGHAQRQAQKGRGGTCRAASMSAQCQSIAVAASQHKASIDSCDE
jgi:hypothetical protein